jgi:hypothetical protein
MLCEVADLSERVVFFRGLPVGVGGGFLVPLEDCAEGFDEVW